MFLLVQGFVYISECSLCVYVCVFVHASVCVIGCPPRGQLGLTHGRDLRGN